MNKDQLKCEIWYIDEDLSERLSDEDLRLLVQVYEWKDRELDEMRELLEEVEKENIALEQRLQQLNTSPPK